jgi:hypothetical protein
MAPDSRAATGPGCEFQRVTFLIFLEAQALSGVEWPGEPVNDAGVPIFPPPPCSAAGRAQRVGFRERERGGEREGEPELAKTDGEKGTARIGCGVSGRVGARTVIRAGLAAGRRGTGRGMGNRGGNRGSGPLAREDNRARGRSGMCVRAGTRLAVLPRPSRTASSRSTTGAAWAVSTVETGGRCASSSGGTENVTTKRWSATGSALHGSPRTKIWRSLLGGREHVTAFGAVLARVVGLLARSIALRPGPDRNRRGPACPRSWSNWRRPRSRLPASINSNRTASLRPSLGFPSPDSVCGGAGKSKSPAQAAPAASDASPRFTSLLPPGRLKVLPGGRGTNARRGPRAAKNGPIHGSGQIEQASLALMKRRVGDPAEEPARQVTCAYGPNAWRDDRDRRTIDPDRNA